MKVQQRGNLQVMLLGIIIIVALLYMVFIKPFYYRFNGGEIYFEAIYVESFPENTTYDMYTYDGDIYLSSSNGFKKIASDGEHLWDQSYYMPNASLVTGGRFMCVADINGKDAYLFNEEGLATKVNTNYEILMVDVNEVGAMSFLMATEDAYRIEIYNRLGKPAAARNIVVEESGYPIAYDLSKEGDILCVNQIKVEGDQLDSNLNFLGFGDEDMKNPDHIIGKETHRASWIGQVAFVDDEHLLAISDEQLYFYDVSDVPTLVGTYPYDYEIMEYGITDDGIVVVFVDPASDADVVMLFDNNGREVKTNTPETKLTGFDSDDDYYYLITETYIEKYQGDKRIWQTDNARGAKFIARLYREYYVIGYGHSYEIVKMKDL